ncbi:MAG TPA: DUF177 domain-containing protein [Acidobacteriaceae bacterium]
MLITVLDLEREPLDYDVTLSPGELDFTQEITQLDPLLASGRADLLEEHRGPRDIVQDIRLRGTYSGRFSVPCARCIDPVDHALAGEYDLIFRPVGVDSEVSEHSIGASETEIGYYENGSLEFKDVLREQVLLALPARTLCREDCKGLCPRCGGNQNAEPCTCVAAPADPRWSALVDLGSRMKIN